MIKQSSTVQLNDHMATNWKFDALPVAVLNFESTTHERIAYCWGLARNLHDIAGLCISSNDADVSTFADVVSKSLAPLMVMLENLGEDTYKTESEGVA